MINLLCASLTATNIIEICGIVASAILSIVLIVITIKISIKQNKIQNEISKRDYDNHFIDLRLDFYNNLINTAMILNNSCDLFKINSKNDIVDIIEEIYNHEKILMKTFNISKFLFKNNKTIEELAKEIYFNFSEYRVVNEEMYKNIEKDLRTFINEKNIEKDIVRDRTILYKYDKEYEQYLTKKYIKYNECSRKILDILESDEFEDEFKKYFDI